MGKNLEEMCRLVTGKGMWHIGENHVSDGPHGVRAQDDNAKNNDSIVATCFPTACAISCSWNKELVAKMAKALAIEAKELGVSMLLGPGVNIKRSPLCGRNFEYYSEDPYLSGELAISYIKSMQDEGVATSLKHFAGNSQETHRMTSNSMIDDRALHEIYLRAFEKTIKEANPVSIMASYNYLNGISACENEYLLTEVLRKQWKYNGLVISDWGACVNLPACINAGLDVEMPDSLGNHFDDLLNKAKNNHDFYKKLECSVARIDNFNNEYKLKDKKKAISKDILNKHHKLAEEIANECIVLLKNDDLFPLKNIKNILLVGELADKPRIQGGGSSHVNTSNVSSFIKELKKYGINAKYVKGYKTTSFKRNAMLEKQAIAAVKDAKQNGVPVLFFAGLTDIAEGEGYDRDSYNLPDNQSALLKKLLEIDDNMGCISFSGSPYDMGLVSKCKGLMHLYLGGEGVVEAAVKSVLGITNPSGKLAESIPFSEKDVPSFGCFARQGSQNEHIDDIQYRESIFVGYRYYDTFNIPIRYCFGFGLSYTKYNYSNISIKKVNDNFVVSFQIENIGDIEGSEISQVYVKNPKGDYFRANKELRGFSKNHLRPKEKKNVEIVLDDRAFDVYQDGQFQKIEGTYEIQVGASLVDIRLSTNVEIKGEKIKCTLKKYAPLSEEDFKFIYHYEISHFSNLSPGEFSTKNSLVQMKDYSVLARRWIKIGKLLTRIMYFPKPLNDPEVRMMLEGILEGNIDSVCNQSGGVLSKKTIDKVVASANKGE